MNKIKINWFGKFVAMLVAFFALLVGANAVPYKLNDFYQYPSGSAFPNSIDGKQSDYYMSSGSDGYVCMSVAYADYSYTIKNSKVLLIESKFGITNYYYHYYTTSQGIYFASDYTDSDTPDTATIYIYVVDFPNNPDTDTNPVLIHGY